MVYTGTVYMVLHIVPFRFLRFTPVVSPLLCQVHAWRPRLRPGAGTGSRQPVLHADPA